MTNKTTAYCYRVRNYEQYLHDVGELRALGYSIDDEWNALAISRRPNFRGLYLHTDLKCVALHPHTLHAERVPNLEYIINELPVVK